jgi:hypothetical protein
MRNETASRLEGAIKWNGSQPLLSCFWDATRKRSRKKAQVDNVTEEEDLRNNKKLDERGEIILLSALIMRKFFARYARKSLNRAKNDIENGLWIEPRKK